MSLPDTLRHIADAYVELPDWLTPQSGPCDQSGIRAQQVYAPAPIDLDVSDLLTRIGAHAAAWEWELCKSLWLPKPWWNMPKRRAVPTSLHWTARTIQTPPMIRDTYGTVPATISHELLAWIEEAADRISEACGRLMDGPPGTVPLRAGSCPLCGNASLMTAGDLARCVTAGCAYRAAKHEPA